MLDVTDADVWVMDPRTEYFEQTQALKDTDLYRVRGVPGVRYAVRLFKGTPVARAPDGTFSQSIALGLDDATLVGAPRKMLLGSWERLREPDTVVIDKAGYVLLFPKQPLELGRTLELNDHKVTHRRHLRSVGAVPELPGDSHALQRGGRTSRAANATSSRSSSRGRSRV